MPHPTPVHSTAAPAAVGPYSQAMTWNGLLFCSGQIPLDPETGQIVSGGIEAETRQALLNLKAVLRAGRSEPAALIKTTVYLTDMAHFPTVNRIYEELLAPAKPARACIAVAALPKNAMIEIDAIAVCEAP